ncbi:MAG: M48 family metalloprotease [Phycisphaerae bacterium]
MKQLACLFLTLSLFTVGCSVSDQTVIAQSNNAHVQLEPAVVSDPVLDGYLDEIGARIIAAARELYAEDFGPEAAFDADAEWMFQETNFHFVKSDQLNAFTTGGPHVYMYTELFTTSATEDAFAAVVAHEFGHIYGRHVHNGMQRQYGVLGLAAGGAVAGGLLGGEDNWQTGAAAGAGIGGAVGSFIGMGFSRADELEADELGFAFYVRAGYDPERFGDFFQQMVDAGQDSTPEMMSTHPSLQRRVERAREMAAEYMARVPEAQRRAVRRPPVAAGSAYAQLQERAKTVEARGGPEEVQTAQRILAAFPSCVKPTYSRQQVDAQQELLGPE